MGDGNGSRAYRREDGQLFLSERREINAGSLLDDAGSRWVIEEDALVQAEDPSRRLNRLPSHDAYWFGWFAFYPDTHVYGQGGAGP